jgi:hypothetical protein
LRRKLTKSVSLCLIVLSLSGLALAACSSSGDFEEYAALIGMSKTEIAGRLKDESTSIDEGGLAFSKSGVRVWFDENDRAVDIYVDSEDVDFKGARIGGAVESFKEAFGAPVVENPESAYAVFPYEGLFLDVNYDPRTGAVVAVHILREFQ